MLEVVQKNVYRNAFGQNSWEQIARDATSSAIFFHLPHKRRCFLSDPFSRRISQLRPPPKREFAFKPLIVCSESECSRCNDVVIKRVRRHFPTKASRFPQQRRLQQRRLQEPQSPQRLSACPRCEHFWV